jgi:phage antirepressor YoqD-like protein
MSEIILKEYNGIPIQFEFKNGRLMANATSMAKPFGKLVAHWTSVESNQLYFKKLSSSIGITIDELILVKKGSSINGGGTWINERLIVKFAQWLDADFEIWCHSQIETLLREGTVSISVPSYQIEDPIRRAERWIEEQKKVLLLQQENEKLQFRSEFVDVVFDSKSLFSMEQVAKILKLPFGRNTMLKILRDKKLFLQSNTPKQSLINSGYFKVNQEFINRGKFKKLATTTYATSKGVGYIHKVFKTENNIE